jgi:IS30 family transposase
VEAFTTSCVTCQKFVPIRKKPRLQPIISNGVMERLQIDLKEYELYADDNDGYCYILSVVDHFSNYPWAFPLYTKQAEETAYHLFQLFCTFGSPKILQADNGGEFVNHVVDSLATKWKITTVHGKPYNPREQGKVEHFNGTLSNMLAKQIHEKNMLCVIFLSFFF